MEKKTKKMLSILIFLSFGYIIAGYVGIIQSPISNVSDPVFLSSDTIVEIDMTQVSGIVDDDFYQKIMDVKEDINLKVYGVKGRSAFDIINSYEDINKRDNWIQSDRLWWDKNMDDYTLYARSWTRFLKGQVVIASDGVYIRSLTGYDCVFFTSSAPVSMYLDILD